MSKQLEVTFVNRCNCPKCVSYKDKGYSTDHYHRDWYTYGKETGGVWRWYWTCNSCQSGGAGKTEEEVSSTANNHWADYHYITTQNSPDRWSEVVSLTPLCEKCGIHRTYYRGFVESTLSRHCIVCIDPAAEYRPRSNSKEDRKMDCWLCGKVRRPYPKSGNPNECVDCYTESQSNTVYSMSRGLNLAVGNLSEAVEWRKRDSS